MEEVSGNGEELNALEQKAERLTEATKRQQPEFSDFEGERQISQRMIEKDKEWLAEREKIFEEEGGYEDRFERQAEPIMVARFNRRGMFGARNTFAFMASRYDDVHTETDVVLGVFDREEDRAAVFSVDATTATSEETIQDKFKRSAEFDYASSIHYCKYGDSKWSELDGVPHFVVGMMPSRTDDALEKIEIDESGNVTAKRDLDTDFKLMSEIFEQCQLQIAHLEEYARTGELRGYEEANLKDLKDIQRIAYARLGQILGAKKVEDLKPLMTEKYPAEKKRLAEDITYAEILKETWRRRKQLAGKATGKAAGKNWK